MSCTEEELPCYEEDEPAVDIEGCEDTDTVKGTCSTVHVSSFRDFLLKPELLKAVMDCGFEHPSQVQYECLPSATLGMDVICQAKSGMGKTAVFCLAALQQLQPEDGLVSVLVLCPARELAFQVNKEFHCLTKHLPAIQTAVFFGGLPVKKDIEVLRTSCPHIVVGTPGRVLYLVRKGELKLRNLKTFVLDECDKMLGALDMRRDVQEIFQRTNHNKQVMMFTATLSSENRKVCRMFTQDPIEIYVDDESKLVLHGLQQFYVKVSEMEKNKMLMKLLDALEFNQVIIFVKSIERCTALSMLLEEQNFPAIYIHSAMSQEQRLTRYHQFKDFKKRILVATNLFGRGIDIEHVNVVINYDMAEDTDTYLHRVARAGRFGTKGLAITYISDVTDAEALNKVQDRFEMNIDELPEKLVIPDYMPKMDDELEL